MKNYLIYSMLVTHNYPKQYLSIGTKIINKYIESLSTYLPNRKKQPYKNHNAVIRNWLNKDNIKKKNKTIAQSWTL